MRVLCSSISGVGHIYPLISLARALLARGHDVCWAAAVEPEPDEVVGVLETVAGRRVVSTSVSPEHVEQPT